VEDPRVDRRGFLRRLAAVAGGLALVPALTPTAEAGLFRRRWGRRYRGYGAPVNGGYAYEGPGYAYQPRVAGRRFFNRGYYNRAYVQPNYSAAPSNAQPPTMNPPINAPRSTQADAPRAPEQ
jgi:hypothetical protein